MATEATVANVFVSTPYVLGSTRVVGVFVYSLTANAARKFEDLSSDRIDVLIAPTFSGDEPFLRLSSASAAGPTGSVVKSTTERGRFDVTIRGMKGLPVGTLKWRAWRVVNPNTENQDSLHLWTADFVVVP